MHTALKGLNTNDELYLKENCVKLKMRKYNSNVESLSYRPPSSHVHLIYAISRVINVCED